MNLNMITRAIERRAVADKPKRTITAIVNSSNVDRYKTVIEPSGLDLAAYRTNPVVLWEHGKDGTRGSLPVGKTTGLEVRRTGGVDYLVAWVKFSNDPFSSDLFEQYADGTLRAWSINILPDPKRCSPPTREEIRARPELAECSTIFRGGELAELSAVAVPGNASCLTESVERRLTSSADPTASEIWALGREYAAAYANILAALRQAPLARSVAPGVVLGKSRGPRAIVPRFGRGR